LIMNLNNMDGLTLVELLVSLLLTGIVVTIVFFIYMTSAKAYLNWEAESSFTDCARLVIRSLNNSICEGIEIIEADHSSLTVLENDLHSNKYQTDGMGRLLKNEDVITPADFKISELEFKYAAKTNDGVLDMKSADKLDVDGDFEISPKELSVIDGVHYSFIVSGNKQQEQFDGLVMMRKF
jgi:type II secretory pathway pseudopilin PulG